MVRAGSVSVNVRNGWKADVRTSRTSVDPMLSGWRCYSGVLPTCRRVTPSSKLLTAKRIAKRDLNGLCPCARCKPFVVTIKAGNDRLGNVPQPKHVGKCRSVHVYHGLLVVGGG